MSDRQYPELYALVDEANADEAYLATLSALYDPAVVNGSERDRRENDCRNAIDVTNAGSSLEEVLAAKREALRLGYAATRLPIRAKSQNFLVDVIFGVGRFRDSGGKQRGLLSVGESDLLPYVTFFAEPCGDLSIPVSAAIVGRIGQAHMEQVFLAMCAPDTHSRVKTGAYNMLDKFYENLSEGTRGWYAALEMAATYHGSHEVARDLAFSWLALHDGRPTDSVADLSLDELIACVEAAPVGASIGISSRTEHVVAHGVDLWTSCTIPRDQQTEFNWCVSPRPRYPEDDELTREQVLATLQTPSETLLQALEAAAVHDDEWREAETQALDVPLAPKEGEPKTWRYLDQIEQREFLEAHAPYHVRGLANGGVMLATHPYRYLWPLWADALALLGIRPKTT